MLFSHCLFTNFSNNPLFTRSLKIKKKQSMADGIKTICIVGGGTAGWMAATLLSTILRGSNIRITLVESSDISTIGVGESTVPSIMDFIHTCQIDLRDFIQHCDATFKLGIRFEDWLSPNSEYFHPFGAVGKEVNGFEFYQAWLQSTVKGGSLSWLDFSANAEMAKNNQFMLKPQQPQNWVQASVAHALHFDATRVARHLRGLCLQRGVTRIEATVSDVALKQSGFLQSVLLDTGLTVNADFFIDCTGFKSVLIEQALKVGYQSWSNYLPCDRAVAVQTVPQCSPVPYTIAKAQNNGWSWHIPLQNRMGNGYVYASQFCSDDEAIKTITQALTGECLNEPRVIPFKTGRRNKIWHKNCLALGLSAGFLEPLESTAIHLVYKTLVHFIKYFPDGNFDPVIEESFNKKINADYEEIRDFIILHYCTSGRSDTPFWRWCQQMPIPNLLQRKLEVFRQRGDIEYQPGQLFTNDSWYSILEGMAIRPKSYHPLIDAFHQGNLKRALEENRKSLCEVIKNMPTHSDFIQANCVSKA